MSKQGFKNTAGNPYISQYDTISSALGIDVALSLWKLEVLNTDGATPTGTAKIVIDPAAAGNITVTPNGAGRLVAATGVTCTTGGLIVSAGTTTLTPLAAARAGIVKASATGDLSALIDSNTDGQLLISSSVGSPAWASLTAGANITLTPGPGSISIAATVPTPMTWSREVNAAVATAADHGYVNTNVGLTTFTLPAVAAIGTVIEIIGESAALWTIAQNAGQNIQYGNVSTTPGVGGSLSASNRYDTVRLVCRVANTTFAVTSSTGVLNVV